MNRTVLNVVVSFDLRLVNDALWNTPNVGAKDALMELLQSAISEYGLHDSYGDVRDDAPHLENCVCFEIAD
jgi:hypothetical protein